MILSVASILQGHQGTQPRDSHAMVLDKFDNESDKLVFKITYNDPENGEPRKFEISRTDPDAPEVLYFVHIEIEDMDSLPSQAEREANKKAEIDLRKRLNKKRLESSSGWTTDSEVTCSKKMRYTV